ncbi:MAG: hypothetical protein KGZ56_00860 [Dethiobacter sp.]|nr:hypothetical protein [Dethiobacter sp.]MBS3898683.1 hypothetical protein [Dethiobacter sp.]
MKSMWKLTSNMIGEKRVYGVYRILDVNGVDHSGNREMHGNYMDSREEAMAIAERLNREEIDNACL